MKYQLEKYKSPSSRYVCPRCQHRGRFTRYVEVATGVQLGAHVGRCDRVDSCGYHYTPREYFGDHPALSAAGVFRGAVTMQQLPRPAVVPPQVSYIPMGHAERSWESYERNHLVQWLIGRYGERAVMRRATEYFVGTSAHWDGATVFWQIDAAERIRTGKIMLYDRATGRRVREPQARVTWAHTALGLRGYHLRQCLYGENLLAMHCYRRRPVAIVESEKTAIIAGIHIPDYLWLATGGKEMLTAERLAVLRGRDVLLYPDAGGYELWSQRAHECRHIVEMRVSALLADRSDGSDLADVL